MSQVFISYSRRDIEFVQRLAEDLQAAGLTVWYDLSGLDGGTQWGIEIQSAIEKSQYFLVVLSPSSLASKWVQREFLYAEDFEIKVIPLQYQPCRLPMWLRDVQLIDMQGENYKNNCWTLAEVAGGGAANGQKTTGRVGNQSQGWKPRRSKKGQYRRSRPGRNRSQPGSWLKKAPMPGSGWSRQEKLRQAKAEQNLRKQAGQEQTNAVNQARRAEAWQKWKPRLPRLAGFVGLGLLGMLVLAGLLPCCPCSRRERALPCSQV